MKRVYKEYLRYLIIVVVFLMTWDLSTSAYSLELAGKLTIQFAGICAAAWGALTLILKFIFDTTVSDDKA